MLQVFKLHIMIYYKIECNSILIFCINPFIALMNTVLGGIIARDKYFSWHGRKMNLFITYCRK